MNMKSNSESGLIHNITPIVVLIALLWFLSLFFAGCNTAPGTSTYRGTVVHIAKEGIFNKTWEITLIKGGLTDGSGAFAGSKECTAPERLVPLLEAAQKNGQEVSIRIRTPMVYWTLQSGSGGHFVMEVVQ